jgi:N-acetyl sugar amidotransferase
VSPESRPYEVCVRCVMDTSDPDIRFDETGVCSWCRRFDAEVAPQWFPNSEGERRFAAIADGIRKESASREYDCIVGLSGGIDSSYAAWVMRRHWNLRLLAVHVDAGWNSELAVKNIENIVKRLGIDLHTEVIDWEEMRDLQLAFLRSGVPNQDIPQDHVFFAALYRCAVQKGIRHVLSGGNIATESVLPPAWGHAAMDLRHLKAIHRRFGQVRLRTYPTCSFFDYYVRYPFLHHMRVVRPLNYMPYDKKDALEVLEQELGYRYYGTKHGESRFTKFFQNYWLPTRFGFDKRRAHLSSMILSGQVQRDAALAEIAAPPYDETALKEDKLFVAKKLGLPVSELDDILRAPIRQHSDYPSSRRLYEAKDKVRPLLYSIGLRAVTK